jgi:periplasmic protein TonB
MDPGSGRVASETTSRETSKFKTDTTHVPLSLYGPGWPSRATVPPARAIVCVTEVTQSISVNREDLIRDSPAMLELKAKPTEVIERQQPRRLMLALVLLLVALAGVVIKDRQFWFGTEQSTIDADEPAATQTVARVIPPTAKKTQPVTMPAKKQVSIAKKPAEPQQVDTPAIATTRTVLPPMDVEVVAGDSHKTVRPGSNTTKLEITRPAVASSAPAAGMIASATDAAEREHMSTDAAQPQNYPLLGQQMRVQGSVVLQALIGTDGVIENLRVLTGPSILASAAEQAVREWRFKPIVQNGQPVESQAKITVNFTIKIADGSSKTTIAESRPLTIETLSR